MVDLQIQDFDDNVRDELLNLARLQGISLNDLVCDILRKSVLTNGEPGKSLGTKLAERFAGQGLTAELPEFRGHVLKPPTFEEREQVVQCIDIVMTAVLKWS